MAKKDALGKPMERSAWEAQREKERIRYAVPPVAHWTNPNSYKGSELSYRGKPAERRTTVNLVGKQNTTQGLNHG